jgi:transposase-like protein
MAYSKELRERAIARLLPPINASFSAVCQELNIPYQTLYAWRTQSSKHPVPVTQAREAEDLFDAQTKFTVVLETATLNEVDLAAYCRSKGLYVEQIAQWRAQCVASFNPKTVTAAERNNVKRIQLLERELARKEKALAEAAALMILRKKAEAIWGLGEEQ